MIINQCNTHWQATRVLSPVHHCYTIQHFTAVKLLIDLAMIKSVGYRLDTIDTIISHCLARYLQRKCGVCFLLDVWVCTQ